MSSLKKIPIEKNTQSSWLIRPKSNSQFHYKDITSNEYRNRIKLNPSGEESTIDIRNRIPLSHTRNFLYKKPYEKENKRNLSAFSKADIQSNISLLEEKQKYQNLLKNEKHIRKICSAENKKIKIEFENRKKKLKTELTTIIKNAIKFANKNNPMKSMLPDNIAEIVDKLKQEKNDISLNVSHISKTSLLGTERKPKKNEFLSLLGVNLENLSTTNINIDIDKAWNFVSKWGKGRNVDDILRLKVVNSMMSLAEKKASQKVKSIYEKIKIYKNYLEEQKMESKKLKQKKEEEKINELKKDPKLYMRYKMMQSLNKRKLDNEKDDKKKTRNKKIKKKYMTKSNSAINLRTEKKVVRLNSYRDVGTIIKFIESSVKGSQSKLCIEHFSNIKDTKIMDENMEMIKKKNQIKLK